MTQRRNSGFQPGQNSMTGVVRRRGPDRVPRKQRFRGIVLGELLKEERRGDAVVRGYRLVKLVDLARAIWREGGQQ